MRVSVVQPAYKAMGGKAFAETIADLPAKARENAIVQEILRGNIPDFLRKFSTIQLDGMTYEVMPDYLAIGSDARPGQNPLRSRADSIHVIFLHPRKERAVIVGIPRDSWVSIPGLGTSKINAAEAPATALGEWSAASCA